MNFLRERFPEPLISLHGDVEWPPWLPDLSPCDYFLWGYLKYKDYINKPRTLEALSETITREIGRHLTDVFFAADLCYVFFSSNKRLMHKNNKF